MMLRRRMMGGNESGGLPYDARVEYLQATGTQYISLGYFDGTDAEIDMEIILYKSTSQITILSNQTDTSGTGRLGFGLYQNNCFSYSRYTTSQTNSILSEFPVDVFSTVHCVFDTTNNQKYFTVDGVSSSTTNCTNVSNTLKDLILFGSNGSSVTPSYIGKIKYLKIYKDNTLWLDLIPVRVGQVGYMYDRVSGKLFGNAGTGDFLIGEDVEERYDEYVTFVAQEAGTFTLTIPSDVASTSVTSVSYSVDDGTTWVTTPNVDSTEVVITTPTIASGNKVIWKGIATNYANDSSIYSNFSATGNFKIYGNIVSLFHGDDFLTETSVATQYACTGLFRDNTKVTDVEHLVLGMTTLQRNFGASMFRNCTALKRAFKLNVKTGTTCQNAIQYCFAGCTSLTYIPDITLQKAGSASTCNAALSYMFQGCVSLKKAPKISSNVCSYQQFMHMFEDCTALEEVPSLEDITVCGQTGFSSMFSGCISLKAAPKMPTGTSLNASSFANMFYGCTSLETASELPWTTLASSCYGAMYQGCTSLKLAPILPAETLLGGCYSSMFRGCSSLEYVKMLATDISASNCLSNWMRDVKAGGTFVKSHDLESIPSGNSGVPSTWTIINDTDE